MVYIYMVYIWYMVYIYIADDPPYGPLDPLDPLVAAALHTCMFRN